MWLIAFLLERTTFESVPAGLCPRDRRRKTGLRLWILSSEAVFILLHHTSHCPKPLQPSKVNIHKRQFLSLLSTQVQPAICGPLLSGFGILTKSQCRLQAPIHLSALFFPKLSNSFVFSSPFLTSNAIHFLSIIKSTSAKLSLHKNPFYDTRANCNTHLLPRGWFNAKKLSPKKRKTTNLYIQRFIWSKWIKERVSLIYAL